MSRAGNVVGSFVPEEHSVGPQKRPWTAEDEQRLRGLFKLNGRATKPHVNTPAGPYAIGSVSLWCTRSVGQRKDGVPLVQSAHAASLALLLRRAQMIGT